MERFKMLSRGKKIAVAAVLFATVPVVLFLLKPHSGPSGSGVQPTASPQISQNAPFSILATIPLDNATNISTGETELSFTTDSPIASPEQFIIEISPPLPYSLKTTSPFPTRQVTVVPLGGLEKNTRYTVTVRGSVGNMMKTWSFTTSGEQAESSSGLVKEEQNRLVKESYPLFYDVPFSNDNFSIDYVDKNILRVQIKRTGVEQMKLEVESWIRSKGVDPASHTINYINAN